MEVKSLALEEGGWGAIHVEVPEIQRKEFYPLLNNQRASSGLA